MTSLDEVIEGVYRISTVDENVGFSFNQFLIKDENVTLVHTGSVQMFPAVLEAVRKVIDPAQIRYIFVSHFESDECGALARFLEVAPNAIPICSAVGARQLSGFGICPTARGKRPGETIELGARRLRFIGYPSEPHLWEGLLAYEERDKVLFSADLFIRRGKVEGPVVKASADETLVIAKQSIPSDEGRQACLDAIKELEVDLIAVGHGPVLDLRV